MKKLRFCAIAVAMFILFPQNVSLAAAREFSFSGYEWKVRPYWSSPLSPGPNHYSDSGKNVWVDGKGQLHLKITRDNDRWNCVEVISKKSFGYGKYIFYLASRVDKINENAVLGLFNWSDSSDYSHREFEFEFSRWGKPVDYNAQCVVQPYDQEGNMRKFNLGLNGDYSTHTFIWEKSGIDFLSLRGEDPLPKSEDDKVFSWKYTGKDIPVPGDENVRMNLWLFRGKPPSDGKEVEVIIRKFEWRPQ